MAKVVSGQHMRFQPMKSHAMSHNHRLSVPSYVHSEKSDLNVTYVQTDKRSLTQYVKDVKADYQEHVGRRYQDNFSPLWETLIVVNDSTKDEDIERAIKLIEEKTNLKIVDAVRHKDEGHYDKDGEYIANDHVHLIAKRYDFETHRHEVLNVQQIRELRKDVADTLGIAYTQTKEGEKPKKNVSHHKFREEAQKEQIIELQKELSKDRAKDYNLKEYQARIVNLEGANAELRKELHAQNREINKTKDLEEKERKITELEAKLTEIEGKNTDLTNSLETVRSLRSSDQTKITELRAEVIAKDQTIDQLKEAKPEPINASLIVELQNENKMLKVIKQGLEIELSEAKRPSAAVEIPQGENEVSKEIEKQIEAIRIPTISVEGGVDHDHDALMKYRSAIDNQGKKATPQYFEQMMNEHSGKLGILDRKALAKQLATEKKEDYKMAVGIYNIGFALIKYKDQAKEVLKSVVKSSKSGLESIFSKITGKSLPEVKKERTELPRDITAPKTNEDKMREFVDKQKSPGGDLGRGR